MAPTSHRSRPTPPWWRPLLLVALLLLLALAPHNCSATTDPGPQQPKEHFIPGQEATRLQGKLFHCAWQFETSHARCNMGVIDKTARYAGWTLFPNHRVYKLRGRYPTEGIYYAVTIYDTRCVRVRVLHRACEWMATTAEHWCTVDLHTRSVPTAAAISPRKKARAGSFVNTPQSAGVLSTTGRAGHIHTHAHARAHTCTGMNTGAHARTHTRAHGERVTCQRTSCGRSGSACCRTTRRSRIPRRTLGRRSRPRGARRRDRSHADVPHQRGRAQHLAELGGAAT